MSYTPAIPEGGRLGALLPLFIFLVVYLGVSIGLGDFYAMPILVAFGIAAGVAFIQYPKRPFDSKLQSFSDGAGDSTIILMVIIFLLAGAFAGLTEHIGAISAIVNVSLNYISPSLFIMALFLVSMFVSISIGTSMGTIAAIGPLAVGLNQSVEGTLGIALAAVVGGAMFGDNLSFISDTTIAATRAMDVPMKDKFKVNFRIVVIPAIITTLLYGLGNYGSAGPTAEIDLASSLILIIPYLAVFIVAIIGVNVIWVLAGGIALAFVLGLARGMNIWEGVTAVNQGIAGMLELSVLCLVIGGVIGIVRSNGGLVYILSQINRRVASRRGGELGISALTALVNLAVANNTIAIIMSGPVSREIADRNDVNRSRGASILDTTSCFIQGVIPYRAQILLAISLAGQQIGPFHIISYLYYPPLTFLFVLLFIFIGDRTKRGLPIPADYEQPELVVAEREIA